MWLKLRGVMIMRKNLSKGKRNRLNFWITSSCKYSKKNTSNLDNLMMITTSMPTKQEYKLSKIGSLKNNYKTIEKLISNVTRICSINRWKLNNSFKCMAIWVVWRRHLTRMKWKLTRTMTRGSILWFLGYSIKKWWRVMILQKQILKRSLKRSKTSYRW